MASKLGYFSCSFLVYFVLFITGYCDMDNIFMEYQSLFTSLHMSNSYVALEFAGFASFI